MATQLSFISLTVTHYDKVFNKSCVTTSRYTKSTCFLLVVKVFFREDFIFANGSFSIYIELSQNQYSPGLNFCEAKTKLNFCSIRLVYAQGG